MQEIKRSLSIDRVRPIKKLDGGSIAQSQLHVVPPRLGEFISHPFIGRNAIVMAALDHEGSRKDQPAHLSVIERVAQIELGHVVFTRPQVELANDPRRFSNPFVVIC